MILSQLTLRNFRSYTKQTFSFSPRVTVVLGDNTTGKTNLLEALYLLASAKSFRADQDREMIAWGSEVSAVSCRLSDGEDIVTLEIKLTPLKHYFVNGVARRMIDFIGNFPAVLFWPEHLELVTDSPSLRRKYLDSVLVQVDREYRRNLLSYERGLRQRNRLLDLINEGKASRSQLLFWNQLLIKSGAYLTDKRAEFIDFLSSYRMPHTTYRVEYDKSVISEARLEQYSNEEVAAKATLVGPHRDDMVFQMAHDGGGVDISKYGSRGEQRLAVLWLKLGEVSFIQKTTGDRPILLLDDIFSELDEAHRRLVEELIGKHQTIITSADSHILKEMDVPTGSVIRL